MTEQDIINFCNVELGKRTVSVEITPSEYRTLIQHAIDTVAPWCNVVRYVQASGKVIDLSAHDPIGVNHVWNTQGFSSDTNILAEQMFGSTNLIVWDADFMNLVTVYKSYEMLMRELQYQKGQNFRLINNILYLDGYNNSVLIELSIKAKVPSDISEKCRYAPWVKKYTLALAKELLGRKRGKTTLAGSPISLDAQQLLAEAQAEKSQLENEIDGEIFIV